MAKKLEEVVEFPAKEFQFCRVCSEKLREELVVYERIDKENHFYHLLCAHKREAKTGLVFNIVYRLKYQTSNHQQLK